MTAQLTHIYRHPIKAHGREDLASVLLSAGRCLPFDRVWAVAHEAAKLENGWSPCANFTRGAKSPALMAITSTLDEATRRVTLSHPQQPDLTFHPEDVTDLPRFLDWVMPLVDQNRALPKRLVSAGRGMTDSPFESISILSHASNRALGQRMGRTLSQHRWRGNLWVDGTAPLEEFDWIGRELQIGTARLKVVDPITRCTATEANPETGRRDAPVLAALEQAYDHQDFGVFAVVVQGGQITTGDTIEVLGT